MRQKWRKNRVHFSRHHYKLRRQILLLLLFGHRCPARRVSFVYHKNIVIETRYNIEGAPVYWKHCNFFSSIERYLMAILYSCSQRDIHIYSSLGHRGANRPAIRRFGKKGKKRYIYFYTNTKLYNIVQRNGGSKINNWTLGNDKSLGQVVLFKSGLPKGCDGHLTLYTE